MKPLAITMGDPCGIGPEIIASTFNELDSTNFVVFGDRGALERALLIAKSDKKLVEVKTPTDVENLPNSEIGFIAVTKLDQKDYQFAKPTIKAGDAAYRYIVEATKASLRGDVSGVVTAPINKDAMNRAGHDFHGHTELLASLCNRDDYVMMLAGDVVRVSLVTIHEPISKVSTLINQDSILNTIVKTDEVMQKLIKKKPRIAVCALNPHEGEGGLFGNEDELIVKPAVQKAISLGIDAVGPLSADTLFYFVKEGNYDAVVAMYHDQGLIPLKMYHFEDAVNITLGLPIIRTSVDHGTAYNLAGTGKASNKSLIAAIKMAKLLAS